MKNLIKSSIKLMAVILTVSLFMGFIITPDAYAAKKKKKLTDEEVTQITNTINVLTKKVYAAGLFSPEDNEKLIDIKLKLDTALESSASNKDFPGLYFRTGFVYKAREYKDEAIECFQTVLDVFPDSPYSLRAANELKKMGVKVLSPEEAGATQ